MKSSSSIVLRGLLALLSLSSPLWAQAPAYQVEKSFGQQEFKSPPQCVAMTAQNQLLVLLGDGTVVSYNSDGKLTGSFKSEMKPAPETMTAANDKIYLFGTAKKETVREFQGRKVTMMVPSGIHCWVYGAGGAKEGELTLPGANSATDAHFIGKELVVADYSKQCLVYYSLTGNQGTVTRKIEKTFRLCCGIFDFCPGSTDNSLVAANLGAFKVQTFVDGKKSQEFGARGEKEADFHGCCNPVNVACLADGSIVTVEKSPTSVKIYDPQGKSEKPVAGLAELVAGCSSIPIAVDQKGALYLASDRKNCIVKCVPVAPATPATPATTPVAPAAIQ